MPSKLAPTHAAASRRHTLVVRSGPETTAHASHATIGCSRMARWGVSWSWAHAADPSAPWSGAMVAMAVRRARGGSKLDVRKAVVRAEARRTHCASRGLLLETALMPTLQHVRQKLGGS
jgi:hypothetical protein